MGGRHWICNIPFTVAVPGQLSEKEKKAVAKMDKKMGTAEEEPAEPSESQPHDDDDDDDDDDGIWMEDWDVPHPNLPPRNCFLQSHRQRAKPRQRPRQKQSQ